MAFQFHDLVEATRAYMEQEVRRDASGGSLYLSPRLTDRGRIDWLGLLLAAAGRGDEETLAESLRGTGRLATFEARRSRSRPARIHRVAVPKTAAATLAEGEFNRYYIRALCLRALEGGATEVAVYRAKEVDEPRAESVRLLGRRLSAAALLEDLRLHAADEEPSLKVPGGPNSGLSVRLVEAVARIGANGTSHED